MKLDNCFSHGNTRKTLNTENSASPVYTTLQRGIMPVPRGIVLFDSFPWISWQIQPDLHERGVIDTP